MQVGMRPGKPGEEEKPSPLTANMTSPTIVYGLFWGRQVQPGPEAEQWTHYNFR
jgi:hypothetical protein